MRLPRILLAPASALPGTLVVLLAAAAAGAMPPPSPGGDETKEAAPDADLPRERDILKEASSDSRNRKPDAFEVLRKPVYLGALEARKMDPGEWVIGVEVAGKPFAYPVNVLNHHEILIDEQGGTPFMVCWCPLCRTGAVHLRTLDDKVLDFGHSGRLYRSSFLLHDKGTGSLWHHVQGRALTGKMRGRRLSRMPSVFVTWDVWRRAHPDTLVLAKDPQNAEHAVDVFGERNRELKLTWGLGIEAGGVHRLYEFTELEQVSLVQETVSGVPVIVVYHAPTQTAVAWDRRFGEKDVVLDLRRGADTDDGRPTLEESGERRSTFDAVTGVALAGPLKGERLRLLPASHWEVYAWMAHHPAGTAFRASVPVPVELPPLPDPDPPKDGDGDDGDGNGDKGGD